MVGAAVGDVGAAVGATVNGTETATPNSSDCVVALTNAPAPVALTPGVAVLFTSHFTYTVRL